MKLQVVNRYIYKQHRCIKATRWVVMCDLFWHRLCVNRVYSGASVTSCRTSFRSSPWVSLRLPPSLSIAICKMCRIGVPASGVGEWGLQTGSPG